MDDLYINEDALITLTGVRNAQTSAYINDAAVSFDLIGRDGTVMATGVEMTYVTSSNGNYEAILSDAVTSTLVEGRQYVLVFDVAKLGANAAPRRTCVARYREI